MSRIDLENPCIRIVLFFRGKKKSEKKAWLLAESDHFLFLNPYEQVCGTSWPSLKRVYICLKCLGRAKMPSVLRGIWLILVQIIQISSLLEGWDLIEKCDCSCDMELLSETRTDGWWGCVFPPWHSGCPCHSLQKGSSSWAPPQQILLMGSSFSLRRTCLY